MSALGTWVAALAQAATSDLLALDINALTVVAGIGVFLTFAALALVFAPNDPMVARLRNHRKRRQRMLTEMLQPRRDPSARRRVSVSLLRQLLDKLKLLRSEEARKTTELLAQAGWRSRDMLVVFLAARLMMPVIISGGGVLTADVVMPQLSMLQRGVVAGLCLVLGGYGPVLLLRNAIKRRQDKIRKQLPDCLDLLVICAEAGLSLDAALTRVAREMGASSPELADEFGLTAIELSFLPDRRKALANLVKRVDLAPIRAVVNTLAQTERYGTPLAHALRVLASEFRDERILRAEEKAARLPAIMTVPMICFILPALFVVIMGPAVMSVLQALHH